MKTTSQLSRRSFLSSLGVFAAASAMSRPMRLFAAVADDAALPLPDYWRPHLEAVAGKVNALAQKTADGFWFITDLHITANKRQSGKALAALTQLAPALRKTFCGGDLPEAFSARFESSKAGVDYALDYYRLFWVEPVERAGQLLYTAKGNHDFTIRYDAKTDDGFTYSPEEARRFVMQSRGCQGADIVTNKDDPTACYYYFDNAAAKIRYIFADTTDTVNPQAKYWGVVYGMHEPQMRWLADNAVATIPAGWNAVLVHHIPLADCVGSAGDENRFREFRQLLEAYQNREKIACFGKEYDFTGAQGHIFLDLTGHEHAERQTFRRGILHVTEPCDAAYGDYIIGSQPWCGDLPRKQGGTVSEQTFDAVQLDPANGLVYFTRVGGGQDRAIHTRPLTVKAGGTLKIDARMLSGPLTWGCHDADRISYIPNPKSRYCPLVSYHNDVATIAPDGTLTAKKPGEAMVLAMDARLDKEIFPVTVVG